MIAIFSYFWFLGHPADAQEGPGNEAMLRPRWDQALAGVPACKAFAF